MVYSDIVFYEEIENGRVLWSYTTEDDIATVTTAYYFDAVAHVFRSGDEVMVTASDGNVYVQIHVIDFLHASAGIRAWVSTFNV